MLRSTRFRLPAAALVAATTLMLVLRMGAAAGETDLTPIPDTYPAGEDTQEKPSPCSCRDDPEKNDAGPFEIVRLLHPRWNEESLRKGEDFAMVYADMRGLTADFYLLRVYASGEKALASLVDRRGNEFPFDAAFAVVGKGVQIYVDFLGGPADGNSQGPGGGGSGDPPTPIEMELTCGGTGWVTIEWTNEDGSKEYWAECYDE